MDDERLQYICTDVGLWAWSNSLEMCTNTWPRCFSPSVGMRNTWSGVNMRRHQLTPSPSIYSHPPSPTWASTLLTSHLNTNILSTRFTPILREDVWPYSCFSNILHLTELDRSNPIQMHFDTLLIYMLHLLSAKQINLIETSGVNEIVDMPDNIPTR